MSKLFLTVALDPYEHAIDLLSGRSSAEGIDVNWLRIAGDSIAMRFAEGREFDVAELSLADYVARVSRGDRSILALPVFLNRQFMPGALWVRDDGPVKSLEDLRNGLVRCACDDDTVAVYARHWLNATIPSANVEWMSAGTEQLRAKLAAGEIEAAFSLSRLDAGKNAQVHRLVEEIGEAEAAYYRATKVFPILRVLCLLRDAAERHPWLPASLFEGFDRAKRNSLGRIIGAGMSRYPLPWLNAYVTRARTLYGEDFWPYGIEINRPTVEAFLTIAKAQGICAPSLTVQNLFWTPPSP
jgi:4,5-dihydroxyphthalate decarboxylase